MASRYERSTHNIMHRSWNASKWILIWVGVCLAPVNSALCAEQPVRLWLNAAIQSERQGNLGAPATSRVLAVISTCMYDAWVAYDRHGTGTELRGALRRPEAESTVANKEKAVSYAAYVALADLFPNYSEQIYKPLMRKLDFRTDEVTPDPPINGFQDRRSYPGSPDQGFQDRRGTEWGQRAPG